jgi:hypothetical protein
MSANPTPTVPATQAPSQIELFWDRYKSIVYVVLLAAVGALVVNYGYKKYTDGKRDAQVSATAASLGLDAAYAETGPVTPALADALETRDASKLQADMAAAPDGYKPYYLIAIARKHIRSGSARARNEVPEPRAGEVDPASGADAGAGQAGPRRAAAGRQAEATGVEAGDGGQRSLAGPITNRVC